MNLNQLSRIGIRFTVSCTQLGNVTSNSITRSHKPRQQNDRELSMKWSRYAQHGARLFWKDLDAYERSPSRVSTKLFTFTSFTPFLHTSSLAELIFLSFLLSRATRAVHSWYSEAMDVMNLSVRCRMASSAHRHCSLASTWERISTNHGSEALQEWNRIEKSTQRWILTRIKRQRGAEAFALLFCCASHL